MTRRRAVGALIENLFLQAGIVGSWSDDGRFFMLHDAVAYRGRIGFDAHGWMAAYESPMRRLWRFQCNEYGEPLSITTPSGFAFRLGFIHQPQDAASSAGVEPWILRELPFVVASTGGQLAHLLYDGRAELYGVRRADGAARLIETAGSAFSLQRVPPSQAAPDQTWRVLDFDGAQAAFAWDAENRLIGLRCTGLASHSFVHAEDGSVEVHCGENLLERTSFDERGLLSRVERGSSTVQVETGANGRATRIRYGAANETSYTYNDLGRITEAVLIEDGVRTATALQWGQAGQLVSDKTEGQEHSCRLNDAGLPCEMRDDAGRPLRFAYDLDHRLIGFEDWLGGHHWVEYLPNDCGEVWMIAGDLRVHRRRDPMGRLISVNVTHDGGSLFSEVCRYDEQGRLAAHNDSISGEAQPAATRAIERDAQGRPVRCNGEELAFDTAGRVIARRQADGAQWRYTWNIRGQLATVRTPQGRETRFAYDALGRVLRRHAAATTTRLIWAGDMLVGDEITHTGGAIQARRFAVHPFSGEPLLMRLKRYATQGDLPVQDQVFVIHCGTSGQPRVVTNGRAEVVWASGMDASSELQPVLARVEWPLRGPAHYADDANGLVLTRNRPYIPALGLHLSPHPLGLLAGADAYGQETAEGNWLAGVVGEVGASAGVLAGTAALATGWRVNPGSSRPFDGATLASALANGLQRPVREPPEGLQCTVGRRYRLWPEPGTTDPLLASLERGVHRALREALVRIAGPVAPPVDSEQHARHAEALRRRPPNPVPPRTHP